jgi:hypothetical protein
VEVGYTGLDGIEEVSALSRLLNVGVNQERVSFGMDVFHHDLEAIETSCFRDLHFVAESLEKIFVDNSIRGSKEGEDVRDEKLLVCIETMFPVIKIF